MWSRLEKEKVNEHGEMVARPESLVKDNYDVTPEPHGDGIFSAAEVRISEREGVLTA
jgi:hypothetical protein